MYKFKELKQYEKIQFAKNESLLKENIFELLDKIRDYGNLAIHKCKANHKVSELLFEKFKKEVVSWISNV